MAVKAANPCLQGALRCSVEVSYLTNGVNARIGAAGSSGPDRFASYCCQRSLKCVLNRIAIGLRLPAFEWHAIVFDTNGNSHDSLDAMMIAMAVNPRAISLFPKEKSGIAIEPCSISGADVPISVRHSRRPKAT